jgi:hypothetical protein
VKKRILVLAGTYAEFLRWCADNGQSPQEAVYLDSERKLVGFRWEDCTVIRTGRWMRNPMATSLHLRLIESQSEKRLASDVAYVAGAPPASLDPDAV